MPLFYRNIVQPDAAGQAGITDIDENLIRDLKQSGDKEAFTLLMNKYKKPVLNFCFRYCGNLEDAEDISQDVFIKVYNNIGSFRGESRFSTWLYRIIVNTCLNHRRWRISERMDKMVSMIPDENDEAMEIEVKNSTANPEQALMHKELGTIIKKSVAKLNKKQRSVLILKDFQGKSYEEIAGIMNMNPGTVKSTLSRGRLIVAQQIKDYYRS